MTDVKPTLGPWSNAKLLPPVVALILLSLALFGCAMSPTVTQQSDQKCYTGSYPLDAMGRATYIGKDFDYEPSCPGRELPANWPGLKDEVR